MTPLEKALATQDEIDYCDQCENVRIVREVGYCGVSGKLLHPLMYTRGEGYWPARRCRKRKGENNA